MKIIYSPKFAKEYKKLPGRIKSLAEQKEKYFRANPFDPRLKTHKLSGKLKDFWAFLIDQKYRIIFSAEGGSAFGGEFNLIYFHSAGDHDIYK